MVATPDRDPKNAPYIVPPTYKLPPIPTPPTTVSPPESVPIDSIALLIVTLPFTVASLLIVVSVPAGSIVILPL